MHEGRTFRDRQTMLVGISNTCENLQAFRLGWPEQLDGIGMKVECCHSRRGRRAKDIKRAPMAEHSTKPCLISLLAEHLLIQVPLGVPSAWYPDVSCFVLTLASPQTSPLYVFTHLGYVNISHLCVFTFSLTHNGGRRIYGGA